MEKWVNKLVLMTQNRFEIKCLSKKFHIKVDNNLYSFKDGAVALKNKSLITVGNLKPPSMEP